MNNLDTAILASMATAAFAAGLLCGIAMAPENEPWTLPDGRVVSYDASTGCIMIPGRGNGGPSTLCGGQSGDDAAISGETLRAGGDGVSRSMSDHGRNIVRGGSAGGSAPSSAAREGGASGYCYSTGPDSSVCTYRLDIPGAQK